MRTMRRNKQKLYYANLIGTRPVYVRDENGNKVVDYVDDSGTVYYQTTGENELVYSAPVKFYANISFSGGESQAVEFGVDISAYDATLVYLLNEFPITETSLIWYQTEPTLIPDSENADPKTADYKVLTVKPSLNYTKNLLGKLVKTIPTVDLDSIPIDNG